MSAFLDDIAEPEVEPALRDLGAAQWLPLARSLGFTADEARLLLIRLLAGVRYKDAPEVLGTSPAEVERLRRAISRKFDKLAAGGVAKRAGNFGGSSRTLAYREVLPSGQRTYVLRTLDRLFQEVMAGERPRPCVKGF